MRTYPEEQERKIALGEQLAKAVMEERYDEIHTLIQQACLDRWSEEGFTALHYAIRRNNECLGRVLLANRANVNSKSRNGETALHLAVENNSYTLCKLLVQNNAETHHQDDLRKSTPLHLAIENKYDFRIQRLLILHATRYHWAIFWSCNALDCQDLFNNTPLHLAIETRQFATAELLINQRTNIDLKNNDGKTARDMIYSNQYENQELLLALNARLERRIREIDEEARKLEHSCAVM